MTDPETPSAPASEPAEAAPAWWTAIDYGLRLLSIGLVVWFAWQGVPLAVRMFGGAALPVKNDGPPVDPSAAPRLLAAGAEPGPWRMAGSEWEFALSKVPPGEVDAKMAKLADKASGTPRAVDKTGKEFLHALRTLAPPREISGGRHEYKAAGQNWKITVIAQGDEDRERILTGAASWRYGPGDWQWLELVPRGDQAAADVPQVVKPSENLLPLLPGASVVASRWSTSGELLLEIVSTPLPFSDFEKEWKRQGYELHLARGVAPESSPPSSEQRRAWFAVRGKEVVYVWSTTQATRSTLLLARTSAADSAGEPPGESLSQPPRESTP